MNKADLVAAVAGRTGLDRHAANQAVEAVFRAIGEAMAKGEEIRILGFGNFVVVDRPAKTGRHPTTGEPMAISASRQPRFRPGKGLKDALNL